MAGVTMGSVEVPGAEVELGAGAEGLIVVGNGPNPTKNEEIWPEGLGDRGDAGARPNERNSSQRTVVRWVQKQACRRFPVGPPKVREESQDRRSHGRWVECHPNQKPISTWQRGNQTSEHRRNK